MKSRYGKIRFLLPVLAIVCFRGDLFAQMSIGRVHKFSGELQIQHEGHILVPAKAGPLFRNANVYAGDTVRTGRGAAELLFDDGSLLTMDESTIVQVDQVNLGATEQKERNVKIILGRVWCKIQPTKTLKTVFEVPDGVAAIRGTTLEIWVDEAGNWGVMVHEGMAELTYYRMAAMFGIPKECGFRTTQVSADEVEFECTGECCIDILFRPSPFTKKDGTTAIVPTLVRDFCDGDILRVKRNPDGSYDFNEVKGTVRVTHLLPEERSLLLPWWLEDPVIPRETIGSTGAGREAGEPGNQPPATVINPGG